MAHNLRIKASPVSHNVWLDPPVFINKAPTLTFTGSINTAFLTAGSIVSLSYTASDPDDGDVIDVAATEATIGLYSYSDAAGTLDETLVSSGVGNYTVPGGAAAGLTYRWKGQAVSTGLGGTQTSSMTMSSVIGPVAYAIALDGAQSAPAHNATAVPVNEDDIAVVFTGNVDGDAAIGNFYLGEDNGAGGWTVVQTIAHGAAFYTADTVSVPISVLDDSKLHSLWWDDGAVVGENGINAESVVAGDYQFRSAYPALSLVSIAPPNDSPGNEIDIATALVATFNSPPLPGAGNINLVRQSDSGVEAAYDADVAAQLTFGGEEVTKVNTLLINISAEADAGVAYSIEAVSGVITNMDGVAFPGFGSGAGQTLWEIKTAISPLVAATDLPNLRQWYDVSDLASVTKDGSNNVSQLADKGANGYDVPFAAPQPLWIDNGENGLDALEFTGIEAGESGTGADTYDLTLFCVAKYAAASIASATPFAVMRGGTSAEMYLDYIVTDYRLINRVNPTAFVIGQTEVLPGTRRIFTLRYNHTTQVLEFWMDGVKQGEIANVVGQGWPWSEIGIGGRRVGLESFEGRFCELFVYTDVKSDTDIARATEYLRQKWDTP